jgi:hypothetical protein
MPGIAPLWPGPYGLLKEINELGRSGSQYGTCSAPVAGENLGCPAWRQCRAAEKSVSGPFYCGIQIAKETNSGPSANRVLSSCCMFWLQKEQADLNGWVYRICAREGEKMTIRESVRVPGANPGDPQTMNQVTKEITIPKFPRPKELKLFQNSAMLTEMRAEEMADRERAVIGQRLGIPVDTATEQTGSGPRPRKG